MTLHQTRSRTYEEFRVLTAHGLQLYAARPTLAEAQEVVRFDGSAGLVIERRQTTTETTPWEVVDA